MRKILIAIVLFFLFSCQDLLNVDPKAEIENNEVFTNRENVEAAMVGCYNALQYQYYYGRNFVIIGDLLSDNSIAKGTIIEYKNLDANLILSDNNIIERIWADIYAAINAANFAIQGVSAAAFLSETEKQDLLGQLYFLRALHYFNLIRLYGAVPFKLSPTFDDSEKNFLPRCQVDKIVDQIIDDLEFSILNIENSDLTKATHISAEALLAKVYLYSNNYTEAYNLSEQVIDDDALALEQNYTNLFGENAIQSPEMIFYLPFSAEDKNRLAEYHFPYQLGGRYENAPSEKLISMLAENDVRKDFVAKEYNHVYYSNKYSDISNGSDGVIVFRLTELLFVKMEAAYFIDSVTNKLSILSDINTVRHRAKIDSLPNDYSGSLLDAILDEKQIEFAFEGKRWFDLIRTKKAIAEVETVTSENQYLLPIPLSEILANPTISNADQNPGY